MEELRLEPAVTERMYARLRSIPSCSTVAASLPVPFFGDIFKARIATVGLNPSHREYVDKTCRELDGVQRRFESLTSLGAGARDSLSAEQCNRAIQTMQQYYQPGKPIYSWFRPLDRVAKCLGFSYEGATVAHLDLVQEATHPTWSALHRASRDEAEMLLLADLPFLRWELETFPLQAVICNGRTAFDNVRRLLGGDVTASGTLCRVTWYVGTSTINGRNVALAGWNIPLARPTGLGAEGEMQLGALLRAQLVKHGVMKLMARSQSGK